MDMEVPPGQVYKRRPTLRAEHRFRSRLGSPYTGDYARSTRQDYSYSSRFNTTSVHQLHVHSTTREEPVEERVHGCCRPCHFLVENKWVRRFFRVCAVVNLLSLMLSASFQTCTPENIEDCHQVFIQYTAITSIDFVLALLYTVQTFARLNYAIYIHTRKTVTKTAAKKDLTQYTSFSRLLVVSFVTLSLWISVGIGIYRTYQVTDLGNPVIFPYLYWFFIPRTLATISALKLFVHFGKLPTSEVGVLLKNIKWKQLGAVILFYMFFTYMFALLGVHWIGGLSERCTYSSESESAHSTVTLMSIPTTHCNPDLSNTTVTYYKNCYDDPNMRCTMFPNGSTPLNIDFRNSVYLGQFRYIVDALFAVYEASSLELWYFMENAAIHGAPQPIPSIIVFYTFLVFFLVFYLQQSIFLVVIIESFADLRNVSDDQSSTKPLTPTILQLGVSEDRKVKLQKNRQSAEMFATNMNKYYVNVIEKVFIFFVVVDAIVTAAKYTGMSEEVAMGLQWWQLSVSILFVFEIVGLLVAHLLARPNQLRRFIRDPYYWYLVLIAVGGLVASLPPLYNPLMPSTALAAFQAFRLPRTIRLVPVVKNFFLRIIGRGQRLLVVLLTVLVFLIWFAVISMLLLGYLKPVGECERLGNQFEGFLEALQSIFQIMLVEGWTDLSSEAMCHRDHTWWMINIYFILIHLFVSFILVNFFTAVILDNLDYDEETKKKKLEKELNTKKITKVPWHLKVFKLSGPNRIQIPKLAASEAPNLTETEVRNFYDAAENTEFPLTTGNSTLQADANKQQLPKLDLLNVDSSEEFSNRTQTIRHSGIQNILSHINDYRQYRKEQSQTWTKNTGLTLLRGVGKPNETGRFVQSEYDEYREKYRLFDSALFCMPPEHKLRRFCHTILTYQCADPEVRPLFDFDKTRKILVILRIPLFVLEWGLFILRHVVSQLPYFTWVMVMITLLTLSFQFEESLTEKAQISRIPYYYWPVDLLFIVATLTELILKIVANGLFFNPKAAIESSWDILDWLIVLTNLAGLVTLVNVCGTAPRQIVTLRNIPIWIEFLLLFRALRPLRLISLIPSMRRVNYEVLILGGKKLLLGTILLFVLVFMFASLGVQLFAGKNGPEGFCNDPNMYNESECVGNFLINIDVSPDEFLPTEENETGIYAPRVWYNHRRDFRFDHIGYAMLTLFEVMTTEGWLDVRDMFDSVQDRDVSDTYMKIYLHIYVFFVVNLGLQLFVGIVVNTYNEHKPDHSALLTVSQKRWTDLMQRITSSLITPIKRPPSPRGNSFGCKIRCFLYKVFTHSKYAHFSTFIIILHSLTLCAPWIEEPMPLRITTAVLIYLFLFFTVFYIIEFLLKVVAFGRDYFRSWRNLFDICLVLLSLCCIVYVIINRIDTNLARSPSDIAVVLVLLKLFTVLLKHGILRNLLITVGLTVVKSASLVGFLASIIFTYSFVGNLFFQRIQVGEAIDHGNVNFDGITSSLSLTIRVVTGENWYAIFWDTMTDEPYCSVEAGTCGRPLIALVWFISYYFFVTFIFINVVIAVLLENFSIFYNEEDTALSYAVVKHFRQTWVHFDQNAYGVISRKHIKLFLRMLKLQTLYTYSQSDGGTILKERRQYKLISDPLILREIEEELHQEFKQPDREKPKDNQQQSEPLYEESNIANEKYTFQGVLKTLAYRAEDISKRLIPHELHSRQELEEQVQFDVAEECILKWIVRFVRPVIISERRRERRITEAHPVPRILLISNDSSAIWDSSLASPGPVAKPVLLTPCSEEDETSLRTAVMMSPIKEVTDSADEGDQGTMYEGESPALAKSYAKLAKTQFVYGFKEDEERECKEWFQMQNEWINNVDENSKYFDDYL